MFQSRFGSATGMNSRRFLALIGTGLLTVFLSNHQEVQAATRTFQITVINRGSERYVVTIADIKKTLNPGVIHTFRFKTQGNVALHVRGQRSGRQSVRGVFFQTATYGIVEPPFGISPGIVQER